MSKNITKMELETTVKKWGNSGGIILSKSLIGKKVKLSLEVIN